jgi:hypothetical protein
VHLPTMNRTPHRLILSTNTMTVSKTMFRFKLKSLSKGEIYPVSIYTSFSFTH